ncbi:MAG: histidine phosphatase family protein [Lachnospiraceae bacterium]|nr:histidine phosphatase family protein [Lachnospiraceae bacterium]
MIIYLTRHGQTNLNKARLMQGLTDEPLNETGLAQARAMREKIGDVHFDAVYASPLNRAVMTGAIIGGVDPSEVITDPRIIEADFGVYEKKKYFSLGPAMTLYWTLPEIFPAPKSVETTASLRERSSSFLRELEEKNYGTVLIACHGGIMRALSGYLEDKKNGLAWRPKPHNCEVRVYEAKDGRHRTVERIRL